MYELVHFEKLTVPQLVKKLPAFYEISRFITAGVQNTQWNTLCMVAPNISSIDHYPYQETHSLHIYIYI